MRIVIDIPEKIIETLKTDCLDFGAIHEVEMAIKDGTPVSTGGDLISREALKEALAKNITIWTFNVSYDGILAEVIDNAPTVELDECVIQEVLNKRCMTAVANEYLIALHGKRPQGRWIQTEIIDDDSEYGVNDDASECSNCKHIESSHYWTTTYYHYCPNCGASMVRGEEK